MIAPDLLWVFRRRLLQGLHQLDLCLISFGCQNSDRFVTAVLLAEQFDGGLVQAGGTEVLPEALKARAEVFQEVRKATGATAELEGAEGAGDGPAQTDR